MGRGKKKSEDRKFGLLDWPALILIAFGCAIVILLSCKDYVWGVNVKGRSHCTCPHCGRILGKLMFKKDHYLVVCRRCKHEIKKQYPRCIHLGCPGELVRVRGFNGWTQNLSGYLLWKCKCCGTKRLDPMVDRHARRLAEGTKALFGQST